MRQRYEFLVSVFTKTFKNGKISTFSSIFIKNYEFSHHYYKKENYRVVYLCPDKNKITQR